MDVMRWAMRKSGVDCGGVSGTSSDGIVQWCEHHGKNRC